MRERERERERETERGEERERERDREGEGERERRRREGEEKIELKKVGELFCHCLILSFLTLCRAKNKKCRQQQI